MSSYLAVVIYKVEKCNGACPRDLGYYSKLKLLELQEIGFIRIEVELWYILEVMFRNDSTNYFILFNNDYKYIIIKPNYLIETFYVILFQTGDLLRPQKQFWVRKELIYFVNNLLW